MIKALTVSIACALIGLSFSTQLVGAQPKASVGEQAFQMNCAVCHPGGGNIINPAKTLHARDLRANGITTPGGIIAKMRDPGPGMTKFDKKTVPDKTAGAIAEYILKTFK